MAAPIFPTSDWSGATMTTFRRDYIRDLVDASVPPTVYYSSYNRAIHAQFFTDTAVNAIKARVETDYAEQLLNVYNTKYYRRITAGDDPTTADTSATAVLLDATMRLVEAECLEKQMADPGFVGSIADKDERTALFKIWQDKIEHNRTFERTRSGSFGSVPLARF